MACCHPPTLKLIKSHQRFGGCTTKERTLFQTVYEGTRGGYCTQFYLGNPNAYLRNHISEEDRKQTAKWCELSGSTFYIHCPLNANLAKPDVAAATKSATIVAEELAQIRGLPAACVLHVGKVGSLELVADRLNLLSTNGFLTRGIHERVPHTLLLEISAGQGTELGKNWEELRHLYEALDQTKVGLVIDTAHAWGSGLCDLQSHESVVRLWDAAEGISTSGISMVHLNGSKVEFGSCVDRHAPLCEKGVDHIWSRGDEGLRSLAERCFEERIDMVSETSNPQQDMELLKKYVV